MLSKRAYVFYVEKARVVQNNGRVLILQERGDKEAGYNLPDKNTGFLLLGTGTSISCAAARLLASSGVAIGFCGSGGSPLLSSSSQVWLSGRSEYRPTEYMQNWAAIWMDEKRRLVAAKILLRKRISWAGLMWGKLGLQDIAAKMESHEAEFLSLVEDADDVQTLLLAEARRAKNVYSAFSSTEGMAGFRCRPGGRAGDKAEVAQANQLIDHGNYLAYGFAVAALHTLGISFAFPLLHGKTRRGGLVFDVADLYKDWLILPAAFGWAGKPLKDFRGRIISLAHETGLLDGIFDFLTELSGVEPRA